jgi:predicted CXXCH cytochrome family protein
MAIIPGVDHLEVAGNCSECHNGALAVGKSAFHVPTVLECDNCHDTTSFFALGADGSFDHTGITSGCAACHNGISAIGMTDTAIHQNSNGECELCHNTTDFADAYPDHTGPDVVGKGCDSCHGDTATGQSDGHPDMSVDCGICHNIQTFSLNGDFEHGVIDSVSQPCADCHDVVNSINAILKTPTPIHQSTNADCGVCHNVQDFVPPFVDHTTQAVTDFTCDFCHDGVSAKGKDFSPHHMPTTDDCTVCHTPGTFASGVYDHFNVVNNCISCHDNLNDPSLSGTGKPLYHLPTVQDCVLCHTTIEFIPTVFNHAGITTNCASCHDGSFDTTGAIGLSANHIPTTDDCSVCHDINDFTSFAGITFNHQGVDPNNNCASCHATGLATPKKVNHIPALEECSSCHKDLTNPGGFASTTFLADVHGGITSGCEGCHTSQFLPLPSKPAANLVKAVDHLPTAQDCDLCHTVAGFTAATSIFDHVGISGNCVSCHDGNFDTTGAIGLSADHIPTTSDCGVCHNTDAFADPYVDHTGPDVTGRSCESCHDGNPIIGKDAKPDHVPTNQDCGVCHVAGGTFAPAVFDHTGIVNNCSFCHNGIDATGTNAKTNHIPITEDCSVCHTPTSFANATFEHQGIVNICASCHDGDIATGKDSDHVPTNGDCVDCHQTTGFKPATFDHVGIVDNCASCHDAGFATPKKTNHVQTNQDCGVCHNPQNFVPATFDHTGIVNNCASCHDGVTAIGMDAKTNPDHITTALDCSLCHTTATFVGGTWDHQGITGNCVSCHDGVIATGSEPQGPGDHFITVQECNACHTTQSWVANDYTHLNNGDYPGDHRGNVGCTSCHQDNDENISYRFNYPGTCAGCHANEYKTDPHKKSESPEIKYTVSELRDCAGACHVYTNANFNVIKKTRNNEHNTNDEDF